MKKIKDETLRLIEGTAALVVAFILMIVYYDAVLPKYGLENSRVTLIVLGCISLVLFAFAVFSFVMYFLIHFRRKRREREKAERLEKAALNSDSPTKISRDDILGGDSESAQENAAAQENETKN